MLSRISEGNYVLGKLPPGVEVPEADKSELSAGVDQLGKDIEALKASLKGKAALLELLNDSVGRTQLGEVGCAFMQNFSWQSIAKAHRSVYGC